MKSSLPSGRVAWERSTKPRTRLDRSVALKVLPSELARDPSRRARLEREAKAISKLNHAHICTLHDIGAHDGIDYLVMEYLEGETLAERLKRGALPLEQALELAKQMASALAAAHEHGIVHRVVLNLGEELKAKVPRR